MFNVDDLLVAPGEVHDRLFCTGCSYDARPSGRHRCCIASDDAVRYAALNPALNKITCVCLRERERVCVCVCVLPAG